MPSQRIEVEAYFRALQTNILEALAEYEPHFETDAWDYRDYTPGGRGGGLSRWIYDGQLFESGGVNFSAIGGDHLPKAALDAGAPDGSFFATGVSLVLHPRNPHIPTIHMNVRYFETPAKYWFGGGIDLTPYTPDLATIEQFHQAMRQCLMPLDPTGELYSQGKTLCDSYFTLPHRGEMRGVGGLFFDHVVDSPTLSGMALVRAIGDAFAPAYTHILSSCKRHITDEKTAQEALRQFQLWRRGRYVEFNLLWDRGTRFGIESGGRAESILMSLPAEARWQPGYTPEPQSWQDFMLQYLYRPQNWVAEADSSGVSTLQEALAQTEYGKILS